MSIDFVYDVVYPIKRYLNFILCMLRKQYISLLFRVVEVHRTCEATATFACFAFVQEAKGANLSDGV